MQATVDYTIRLYTPQDEARVLDLLGLCLTTEPGRWDTPEVWRWKHHNNPFGPSYVLLAEADNGEVIGLRALMRWRFSVHCQTVEAVRPVDTATHPDYRRRGIFTRLTRQALADLQTGGVHLVFNTPNPQSLPGYLKMGWASLGTLQPRMKIARPARSLPRFALAAARRKLGKIAPSDPAAVGLPPVRDLLAQPGIESLLRQSAGWSQRHLWTERSLPYLAWRYERHVSIKYYAVWEESRGQMSGCLILRPLSRYGLNGLIVEDLVLSGPDANMAARLVDRAVQLSSADFLIAYLSPASFQRHALESCGFRLGTSARINLVARELNPMPVPNPQQIQTWGLSMGDLEFL